MFVAAAYGDALGWPNESRGKMSLKKPRTSPSPKLVPWQRREGFPAQAHGETVSPGTYSDDTQLIASIARSHLHAGQFWWRHFTRVELPFWKIYQRGGGGATLRAARFWSDGKAPWEGMGSQYFDAGGNGVAMRVLPHAIRHHRADSFVPLLEDTLLDGVATHGHPRALLGASIFAFTLWRLLRRRELLGFGQLIDDAIKNIEDWSVFPLELPALRENLHAARWTVDNGYSGQWKRTVDEVKRLLQIAQDAIGEGAMFVDRPTLEKLGALSNERGSGVVCSVASIFLASRYATDPTQGVIEAAFAAGADTDTLACMTATLLACVTEGEQLAYRARDVQDYDFLASLGERLAQYELASNNRAKVEPLTTKMVNNWAKEIWDIREGHAVQLLDSRSGEVVRREERSERNLNILEVTVRSEDGQSLRFKRVQKSTAAVPKRQKAPSKKAPVNLPDMFDSVTLERPAVVRADDVVYSFAPEIFLFCRDVDRTVQFYESLLQLRVYDDKRPKQPHVRIEGPFTFVAASSQQEIQAQASIELRFRVRGIQRLADKLTRAGLNPRLQEREGSQIPSLAVRDPDGRHIILVGVK